MSFALLFTMTSSPDEVCVFIEIDANFTFSLSPRTTMPTFLAVPLLPRMPFQTRLMRLATTPRLMSTRRSVSLLFGDSFILTSPQAAKH